MGGSVGKSVVGSGSGASPPGGLAPTVLEFGTGYSTLVMHLALMENYRKYGPKKPFPRCEYPYELFSLDNNKYFSKISKI